MSCARRKRTVDAEVQTGKQEMRQWWEEPYVTLKAEARARELDSGLLKKELVRALVEHEAFHQR